MKNYIKFYSIVISLIIFNVLVFNSETAISNSQIATVIEENGNSDLLIGIKYDNLDFSKPYHIEINHINSLRNNTSYNKNTITVNVRSVISIKKNFNTIPLINWFDQKDEITYSWMLKSKNKNDRYITLSSVRKISIECSLKGFGNISKEKVSNYFEKEIRTHLEKIIYKEISDKLDKFNQL